MDDCLVCAGEFKTMFSVVGARLLGRAVSVIYMQVICLFVTVRDTRTKMCS